MEKYHSDIALDLQSSQSYLDHTTSGETSMPITLGHAIRWETKSETREPLAQLDADFNVIVRSSETPRNKQSEVARTTIAFVGCD